MKKSLIMMCALAGVSATATAGVSDFYVASTGGVLFSVDGDSLEATQVGELGEPGDPLRDLVYVGDNQFFTAQYRGINRYDVSTDTLTSELLASDIPAGGGIQLLLMGGIAQLSTGELFASGASVVPGVGVIRTGFSYDYENGEIEHSTGSHSGFGSPLDYHEMSPGQMLTISSSNHAVSIFDTTTGDTISEYFFDPREGFYPVSMFESGDSLMMISFDGGLFSFDATDGTYVREGTISGIDGYQLAGATVPAPGSMVVLSSLVLGISRRNRMR